MRYLFTKELFVSRLVGWLLLLSCLQAWSAPPHPVAPGTGMTPEEIPQAGPPDHRVKLSFRGTLAGLEEKSANEVLQVLEGVQDGKPFFQAPSFLVCTIRIESVSLSDVPGHSSDVDVEGTALCEPFSSNPARVKAKLENALPSVLTQAGVTDVKTFEPVAIAGVARNFTAYLPYLKDETGGSLVTNLSFIEDSSRNLHNIYPEIDCQARLQGLEGTTVSGILYCRSTSLADDTLYRWMKGLLEYDLAKWLGFSFASPGAGPFYSGGATGSNGFH